MGGGGVWHQTATGTGGGAIKIDPCLSPSFSILDVVPPYSSTEPLSFLPPHFPYSPRPHRRCIQNLHRHAAAFHLIRDHRQRRQHFLKALIRHPRRSQIASPTRRRTSGTLSNQFLRLGVNRKKKTAPSVRWNTAPASIFRVNKTSTLYAKKCQIPLKLADRKRPRKLRKMLVFSVFFVEPPPGIEPETSCLP